MQHVEYSLDSGRSHSQPTEPNDHLWNFGQKKSSNPILERLIAQGRACHLYRGNPALLAESLEVIQRTSALILSAIKTPAAIAEQTEAEADPEPALAQASLTNSERTAKAVPLQPARTSQPARGQFGRTAAPFSSSSSTPPTNSPPPLAELLTNASCSNWPGACGATTSSSTSLCGLTRMASS
jgi:hypothetical protein